MTNVETIALPEPATTAPHAWALRRAWQCGYDAAARCAELHTWLKDDARLLAWASDYDADIEHPAGWAAWLQGYAVGLCPDRAHVDAVQAAGQGKVDELDAE